MSLSSLEQQEHKPDLGGERQREESQPDNTQQPFAQAQQGSPVSIIPIAPLGWRLLAFVMDAFLVLLFAVLLLSKVLLPQYHPVGYSQWMELHSEINTAFKAALENNEPMPQLFDMEGLKNAQTEEMRDMSAYVLEITALIMLIYFVLCERILAGGSLGKSMLRLRVISLNSGRPPNLWESFLRGLIKVCPIINIIFIISYLGVFANRMRRSGHDWLANTVVVSDTGGYVPHTTPPRRRRDEDEDDDY